MTSSTNTIERPGADASAPEAHTVGVRRPERASAEREPHGTRRLLSSLWRSLRQAPAYY